MSVLHLYGVIRASHREPKAEGVRLVRERRLIAVVSEIDDDAVLDDDDARSYLDVLIGLLPGGPVLPIQFGTVAPNERAIREEVLGNSGEELERSLDRLEGMVELRVRLGADPEVAIERLLQDTPELKRTVRAHDHDGPLDTLVELGREASALLAESRDRLGDEVLSRLAVHAEAHAFLETHAVTELHQAYLVRTDKIDDFDQAVSELLADVGEGYQVEYVGPLPAFDFTDVEIDPGAQRRRWGWS